MKWNKSLTRRSVFHSEAISHCEAIFHKSIRIYFVVKEKGFAEWQSLFLLLERVTRLELATSTLARWRSTGWATPATDMSYYSMMSEKVKHFFQKIQNIFSKKFFKKQKIGLYKWSIICYNLKCSEENMALWCSRLARQPVTLEVDGSSPFGVAKKEKPSFWMAFLFCLPTDSKN